MTSRQVKSMLTRRRLIQGSATLAASSFLPGCGGSSAPASNGPTLTTQTISFAPLVSVPYGTATVTLTATASSSLAVTFNVASGPATLSGNILTILAPGSVVVVATQPGNTTYAAATPVSQTLAVTNPNPQTVPTGTITPASVVVSSTVKGSYTSNFAGLSFEKASMNNPTAYFNISNAAMLGLFQRLGPSIVRLGGDSTDSVVWTPNGAGRTARQIAPADVNNLATFLQTTGYKCLYAVNLGGSAPGATYPTTPALAAAEVAYVVSKLGVYNATTNPSGMLIGIEIGNEPDLLANTGNWYAGQPWSVSIFETLWTSFRNAIVAMTPTAPITGPVDADTYASWTIPFASFATTNISMLTQHYSKGSGVQSNAAAFLLTPDNTLVNTELPALKTAAALNSGGIFGMTECASYSDGGITGASNGYAASLWVIDYLFACAQGGASQINFHSGGNDLSGILLDTYGLVTSVQSLLYGLLFFRMGGSGTVNQTTVSAGTLNLTAYAVKTSTGLNVFLLNKDASAPNLQVTVQLPQSMNVGQIAVLTQSTSGATPSITATSGITIQGSAVSLTGGFTPAANNIVAASGSQVTLYVPALSAVLLQLT